MDHGGDISRHCSVSSDAQSHCLDWGYYVLMEQMNRGGRIGRPGETLGREMRRQKHRKGPGGFQSSEELGRYTVMLTGPSKAMEVQFRWSRGRRLRSIPDGVVNAKLLQEGQADKGPSELWVLTLLFAQSRIFRRLGIMGLHLCWRQNSHEVLRTPYTLLILPLPWICV